VKRGSELFERAASGDVDELVALRDQLAKWLIELGIQQWLPGEFSRARMRAWVERGDVLVHRRDARIAAAVAVLDEDTAIWHDDHESAGYVHLLMVDRAHAGVGLGDVALAHAEDRMRGRGRPLARLDVVASNAVLRRWYGDRGYEIVGTRAFEDLELFDVVLLEKPLT
jgi:protein-tyrosine phosphatase